MHVIFLNPQGNFDPNDSHMTEHPDFGGQLIYVKETCMALARLGVRVDIVTRLIDDPEWPEFSGETDHYPGCGENPRIVRIPCGGPAFLRKEDLWEHLDEFTDGILGFYGEKRPGFMTAHYADGGYCGVLLKKKAALGFTFTGHSLGAQKLDKLGMNLDNFSEMDSHFFFRKRIQAERLSMEHACNIITSTVQERMEQYAHPLYRGAVDPADDAKFTVIPPGVNTAIFNTNHGPEDDRIANYIRERTGGSEKPFVIASSRLDEKKNQMGLVEAFANSPELNRKANLALVVRGVDDPYEDTSALQNDERELLGAMLDAIEEAGIKDRVFFLDLQSQEELASAYRYFARLGSAFALTAFYEPFGLAPIEAAACGLSVVATKNGGPSEIFERDTGVLVDPFDTADIARGLLKGIDEYDLYAECGRELVEFKYTWQRTAEAYLRVIERGAGRSFGSGFDVPELDATERIRSYLEQKEARG